MSPWSHSLTVAPQAKDADVEAVGRVPSEAGDEQAPEPLMSTQILQQASSGEKPKADIDHGKENLDRGQSTANVACDKEKEKKPAKHVRGLATRGDREAVGGVARSPG